MVERRQASGRSPVAIAIVLVAAISMMLPSPVAAQTTLTLDPAEGPHGGTVDAIGAGYPPDSSILLLWDGQLVKSVTSGSATSFKATSARMRRSGSPRARRPPRAPALPHRTNPASRASPPANRQTRYRR